MEVELYSVNDLQKLCRLCMETGSELYSIYNLTPLDDMGLHIQFVEMIVECTSLNIGCDDGLPKSACMECLNYLGTLYSFKQRCTKSDKKLRELIEIFKEDKYKDNYELTENDSEELITIDCDDKIEIKKELKSPTINKFKGNIQVLTTKDQHQINKRKSKLQKRNESEEKIQNLECAFCFKKFTCETNLKLHLNACQTKTVNCGVCSKDFSNTVLLKTHLAEVHLIEKGGNEDKICDICDAIFSDRNKLLFHYRMHIDMAAYFFDQKDDNSLICYYCYEHFINVTDFENHIKVHIVSQSTFACRLCDYESTEDRLVKNHLKSHGINPLICNLCLLSFISNRKFRLHLKTHKQINKLVYCCLICKEKFSTRNEIKNHIQVHIKDLQTCSTCSRSFKNVSEYESHQKEHNKSILCTVCGKLFPGKSRLDSHMLLHDGIKPFPCSLCDKSFRTKTILSNHELTHSDVKPYVCSWCGYSCRRSGDLHIHHRIHTGDRPYSCSFPGCNSTFKTSSFMHQHMRRHTGDGKVYSCELCNKTFTVADSLKRHMLIHTDERPHKCDVCGKCFRRKYHVKVHKTKVHHQ